RRDVASLQTMGFTRRQVVAMIAVQAVGVGLAALVIGVPLGLLAGRIGWNRFADHIRVVAVPSTTPAVLATVALAVLAIALLAGITSGLKAAFVRPARVLRTELE